MPKGPEYSSMSYEDLSSKLETTSDVREVKAISKEAKERDTPATHDEIMATYRGGKEELRGEVATTLFEKAFEGKHIDTLDQCDGRIPEKGLTKFPPPEVGKENEPQVFFKQIMTDEVSWGQKMWNKIRGKEAQMHASNEVLVIIRMNNDEGTPPNPEKSTVVCGIMKQENGRPVITPEDKAYFWVMSEKQYQKELKQKSGEDPSNQTFTVNAEALRGNLTTSQYEKAYKEENGQSLKDYYKERDSKIENDPAHWTSERVKGETLHKLNEQYGELLQKAQERMDAIVKETEDKRKEAKERQAKLAKDKVFSSLMHQVERGFNDQTIFETLSAQIIAANEGVTQADLDAARAEADKKHQEYLASKRGGGSGGSTGGSGGAGGSGSGRGHGHGGGGGRRHTP